MSRLLMVYYMSIPDIAWGEENGESKPMGTIDGKSCFIPVVSCEKNKNPRNVLDICFNCPEFKGMREYAIECNYERNKKQTENIQEIKPINKKQQNKNVKKPSGVFTP